MADLTNKPFLQELRKILADGVKRIDNDECSEAYAKGMLNGFNAESKGYYNNDSFVNYDKAMRITGIKSREKLRDVCTENKIKQKTINNQKVGFLRYEIEYLASILRGKKKNGGVTSQNTNHPK